MSLNAGFLPVGASRVDCIISRGLFLTAFWFFFFFLKKTVNEQRFSVKHDFCSPDTLSWVPHSHIRSPFKTSRTGWIFFRLYTCPPVLPSVKRNCYLLPVSNCVCFPYSYIFKADRSNLWGKVSHFLSCQRPIPPDCLLPPFLVWNIRNFGSGIWQRGARRGVKTVAEKPDGRMGATQCLRFLSGV